MPPFTIEDDTDGGDDLRMKFRYLDLRRSCVRKNLELRHKMTMEVRRYLDSKGFLEIETPMLVGSTPEGARDFVVPSRMNQGQFYALPQSPQTLKQLLMVSGMDRYFQIVKCFRDEDLRADRQPEFTQIDCEMSFVEQDDIINLFEGMAVHLFKELRGVDLPQPFVRMPWADAMKYYGSDKPDLRFGMKFVELMDIMKGHGFGVFDNAAYVGGICAPGAATYTRKQLDQLTDYVKRPQIGAKGMVYARVEADGTVKSSVDKFYSQEYTYGASANFHAVYDHIIGIGSDSGRIGVKQRYVLIFRMSERMMHGHKALLLVAPFKHGEINDPKTSKLILVAQTELTPHFKSKLTQLSAGLHDIIARQNENKVARVGIEGTLHLLRCQSRCL